MVGRLARQARVDNSGMADFQGAADESLVERNDGPVGRERPEPGPRGRDLSEAVGRKRTSSQCVEPVVEVADDQGRQMGRLAEEGVLEQVARLPVPFALGKAFCYYYRAVHQGHVPRAEDLKQYYQEQLALAGTLWKR